MKKLRKLTPKQQRFVNEYLIDLNATQAATRAGYSAKTANEQGARLLADVSVQESLSARMKAREARTEITQDRVLSELAKIAFSDQRKVMSWGSSGVALRQSDELSDDEAAIVAEVSETVTKDGGTMKLKTHDKVKALELIGKHLGMFKDKIELTGKNGDPIQMEHVSAEDLTDDQLAAILKSEESRAE